MAAVPRLSSLTSLPLTPSRAPWLQRAHGPRAGLVAAAVVIELGNLALWPTLYLADSSVEPSPLGSMLRRRFGFVGPATDALESVVDWVFPGALWSWEQLVTLFLHTLMLCFVAYALASWSTLRSREGNGAPTIRWVLIPLLVFQMTLFLTPATLTTDIYNYAIYGEMPVRYAANPFLRTPGEFPQSALYYLIPTYWHDAPSVYGPLWIDLSTLVAGAFQSMPLIDEILAYRFIATAAHFANTVLIWRVARHLRPATAVSAAVAYGWNPSALLEFALNGHNDVLMLTPLLGAALLGLSRPRLAALLLASSIALKYTSLLVAPLLVLWTSAGAPLVAADHRRLLSALRNGRAAMVAVACTTIPLGTLVLLYAPWFQGIQTLGPVLYWMTGPRLQNYWPEPSLIAVTAWVSALPGTDYGSAWAAILPAFKNLARIALVATILRELWRARDLADVLAGSARIWIVFLLVVNTWIMPWYYLWPLAIVAALGWDSLMVRVCAGLTLTAPLVMYGRQLNFAPVGEWAGATLVLPILMGGFAWLFAHRQAIRRVALRV